MENSLAPARSSGSLCGKGRLFVPSIFLSHNSNDKPFVRKLAGRLSDAGVVVWLDEVNLRIGDSLVDKIADAINNVHFVAAVISANSITSPWVRKELSLAMTKEINGDNKVILPIVIDDCELPNALKDKLYADFRKHRSNKVFEEQSIRLLQSMGVGASSQTQHANGLTVDWTDGGPVITGNGVQLSQTETNALTKRFQVHMPHYIEKAKKDFGDDDPISAAFLAAVFRSCTETYAAEPTEEEMAGSQTELARKMDLFYWFMMSMAQSASEAKPESPHNKAVNRSRRSRGF
jgi:hypothetical protein